MFITDTETKSLHVVEKAEDLQCIRENDLQGIFK